MRVTKYRPVCDCTLPRLEKWADRWMRDTRFRHAVRGLLYGKNARSPAACCPATDSIHLPLKEQFPSAGDYYSTLLHELGHWTGHPARLNRDLSDPFGQSGTLEKS